MTEFVFSLLATPRQERRVYQTGFDLRIDDTKVILDKISYKIQTDHDILHNEFTADVLFKGDKRLTFNSYEQFFATSDVQNEEIEKLSITLSVVIPFNRTAAEVNPAVTEKSFEKQTIFILVKAGPVGSVEVDIRSTEITWSEGYFSMVDQHFQKMTRAISTNQSATLNTLFFLYPLFLSNFIDDSTKEKIWLPTSQMRSISTILFATFTSIMIGALAGLIASMSDPVLFNPDIGKIEIVDIKQLIIEEGWETAASMIRDTQILSRLDGIEYADGSDPQQTVFYTMTNIFLSKTSISISIGLILLVFSNFCYARIVAASRVGRIFLYNDNLPPRPKGKIASGILVSLLIGALGSVIASGFISIFLIY